MPLLQNLKASFQAVSFFLMGFIQATWMPYDSLGSPIRHISTSSSADQETLTKEWRTMKLSELNVVAVTAALVASVVTGAMAWSDPVPWTVRGFWLSALVFGLFSIAIATQQIITLTRASTSREGLAHIRTIIGSGSYSGNNSRELRKIKLYLFVWQVPTMLLGMSIVFLLAGIMVMVYAAAKKAGVWGPEIKVAIWFSLSVMFGIISYLISWSYTEWELQDVLKE